MIMMMIVSLAVMLPVCLYSGVTWSIQSADGTRGSTRSSACWSPAEAGVEHSACRSACQLSARPGFSIQPHFHCTTALQLLGQRVCHRCFFAVYGSGPFHAVSDVFQHLFSAYKTYTIRSAVTFKLFDELCGGELHTEMLAWMPAMSSSM